MPLFPLQLLSFGLLSSLVMLLPALVDGLAQAFTPYESNNYFRLLSGVSAGVGLMSLIAIAGQSIGHAILSLLI